MKEHLKIILLRIKVLLIFSTILVSCLELQYLKNKIIIKSFSIVKKENFLELKFDVDYYSDSTIANYYAESIEKGKSGIDGEVIFFGSLNQEFTYSDSCQYFKFKDIATMINETEDPFEGRDLERLYHKVCMPMNFDLVDSSIVLVIKHDDIYDTIYNTPQDTAQAAARKK